MTNFTRQTALLQLLALPDPPGMRRAYRYTQTRKGDADLLKRDLGTAYVERRRQERGKDISCVVSLRTYALKLVRKA